MNINALPYRRRPCAECPWRRDVEPGQFTKERFDALVATAEHIHPTSYEDVLNQKMFACHKSPEGGEEACAGWLAVAGRDHIGVRVAVARNLLPGEALSPGEGWPELFDSYDEMARTQGRREDEPEHDE
ncbi:DUF6283 family protein [Streptomyces roseifaciens]